MFHRALPLTLAVAFGIGVPLSGASAQSAPPDPTEGEVIVAHTSDMAWMDGPPSLPAGAQFVLLEGNPAEAKPLTLRLRFPANYRIPPHWHSVLEHVTVFRGTLYIGMGEVADYSGGEALSAGDYGVLPTEMIHYAWTGDQGVEFQLHSTGPWSITYANPEDDPRNQ